VGLILSNAWERRYREVLFRGRGGECDSGLNILRFQAGKIGENLVNGIAAGQACENCTQALARLVITPRHLSYRPGKSA
jgi:hypothetical protein